MFKNKIDSLINEIIDKFFEYISKTKIKMLKSIINEKDFVKYQADINELLLDFFNKYDINTINNIVKNEISINMIMNTVKRYIALYLLLFIAVKYQGNKNMFINNLIEISRNQSSYKFNVNNFFNSEHNSLIIKYYELSRGIKYVVSLEPNKYKQEKEKYKHIYDFIEQFNEHIIKIFKLENLSGDEFLQTHNIIKIIIIYDLYLNNEKKQINETIETAEANSSVFTFIDILIPREEFIDFNMIRSVLEKKDLETGLVYDFYDMIKLKDTFKKINNDEKIRNMINNKMLIPITEDYMRYHKDDHKYEKDEKKDEKIPDWKKKEDTKIKYILSKIELVSNYYSNEVKKNENLNKEILEYFNISLRNRRAILSNLFEEAKIIGKIENIQNITSELYDYYNELISIRKYPYLNFNDFNNYGFPFTCDKTIEALRDVSLHDKGLFRQNKIDNLQTRIGSDGLQLNIVGFVIPTKYNLECLTVDDLLDIKNDKKNKKIETYKLVLKYLNKVKIEGDKKIKPLYWLFNLDEDVVKTDEYINISSKKEIFELMISKLYDEFYDNVINNIINEIKNKENITFKEALHIADDIQNKTIKIDDNEIKNNIMKNIKQEPITKEIKEDNNMLMLGVYDNKIKLINNEKKKDIDYYDVKINETSITKEDYEEVNEVSAICQHFVDWDIIFDYRSTEPNKFSESMFNFIAKYVHESHDTKLICKSCGALLDIRRYVSEGSYEDERFVSFSTPIAMNLTDIPEYKKYKLSIRYINDLIEKICSITNIQIFVGKGIDPTNRRNRMVKNIIDQVLLHNKNIKDTYQQRKQQISSKYGINTDYTRLFRFDLDNSIFTYSREDMDKFKEIKYNNIISYIIINIIIELSNTQVLFLTSDKICNYSNFEKAGHIMLEGLRIIRNKNLDVIPVRSMRIFSFLVYYFSCMATKYKLWVFKLPEDKKERRKYTIFTQKTITHTIIDLLNSFLERTNDKNLNYIYEILTTKYFINIDRVYKNKDLIKRLHQKTIPKKSQYVDMKEIKPIKLTGEYKETERDNIDIVRSLVPKYYLPLKKDKNIKYLNINFTTNRQSGEFRDWVVKDNRIVDKKTGDLLLDLINKQNKNINDIFNNYKKVKLQNVIDIYNYSGNLELFMRKRLDQFNENDYDIFNKKYIKSKMITYDELTKKIKEKKIKSREYYEKNKSIFEKIKGKYEKQKKGDKYFSFLYAFLFKIKNYIRNDDIEAIDLIHDKYIIDHNEKGNMLGEKIVILNREEKIKFKKNHPFFNKDVIYYRNEVKKLNVFYDANNYILLGYKEDNKNIESITNTNSILVIKRSLLNRIIQFGYEYRTFDIKEKINELKILNIDDDVIIKKIISEINIQRISRLKQIIRDIVQHVYQIIHGHIIKNQETDIYNTYHKKLQNIEMRNEEGKGKVFKNWIPITRYVRFNEIKEDINIDINDRYIHIDDLYIHDITGNILIYYIINEFDKMIEYNKNKFVKINLANLFVDLLNESYEKYDMEEKLQNNEIKKFIYQLNSSSYLNDIEDSMSRFDDELNTDYSGLVDYTDDETRGEKLYTAIQESEALDVENSDDIDYQVDYTYESE